jgi:RNA polymerase sigma-70 factor (ECF subfamily)
LTSPAETAALRDLALRVSSRIVVSREDAEDIAQETVLRATQQWARISRYARAWTVRVATNLAIAHLRRTGRSYPLVIDDTTLDPHLELRLDLSAAVTALPVRQRQAIVLRYLADLDEATVARLLGCSRGSVKRHIHRAVQSLRASARLEAPTPAKETHMTTPSDWTAHGFIAAVEPASGWPPRPWDHWFVQQAESRDRVAVDSDGRIVIDADGDEVMSGPGFNHEVVKVLPRDDPEPPEQPDPRPTAPATVSKLLDEALTYAAYFGHPWVGDEHLGLALAARRELADIDEQRLSDAVAGFYEGPWAEHRLAIVQARKNGTPFTRQPDANYSWTRALNDTLATADSAAIADIANRLLTKERSLVVTLVRR